MTELKDKIQFEENRSVFRVAKEKGLIPSQDSVAHRYDIRDFAKRSQKSIRLAMIRSKSEYIRRELLHSLNLLDMIILRNEEEE